MASRSFHRCKRVARLIIRRIEGILRATELMLLAAATQPSLYVAAAVQLVELGGLGFGGVDSTFAAS